MQVTFLGCGDAFGSGGRYQTCILLASPSQKVLLDCGCSALIAMRRYGVDPNEISAIFLTHLHGDHFGGVPFFLLDAQMISKRTAPLAIVGPPGTKERIISLMEVMFPGSSKVQRAFTWEIFDLEPGTLRDVAGAKLTTYPMVHPSGSPSTAVRINFDGRTVVYSGDTEWNDGLAAAARGSDLLISECYSYDTPVKFHLNHQILVERLPELGVKRVILTHMGREMLGRVDEAAWETAADGMMVEI